ncbi:MAG: flagellar basal-body MS-ring/collar protein FliF [Treponemataceae bacterium]|nr:MAG: flagellar basal-body MS-ring/collar protein FliF [Treponemataceae bacterium]
MNEWIQKLVASVKNLWAKGSTVQKVIFFAIIAVALGALIFVFSFSTSPSAVPLFSTPIADEAARDRIMLRLDQENAGASLSPAGLISVPDEATARRMRTLLMREDLVPSSVDPWALFDMKSWTVTDFQNKVTLRRSITEAVKQHIQAIDDIDNANVIVTMPERTLFASEQNPVTASVSIYPKPGSDIRENKKKIQGIEKLLKFAVEGLKEENIVITDENGMVLNNFEDLAAIEAVDVLAKQQKLIAALEKDYRGKVLAGLQKTFGEDRVRDLNLKIDMDMSKKSSEYNEYKPITIKEDNPDTPYDDSEVVESIPFGVATIDKKYSGHIINPEGPGGVEGQNSPVYADMSNLVGDSEEHSREQKNAINSKKTIEEKNPSIDRVTVSVNIDGTWKKKYDEKGNVVVTPGNGIDREYTPLDQAVIDNATALIQDAVGYSRTRGDSVTVRNIAFDRTAQFEEEDGAYFREKNRRLTMIVLIFGVAGAVTLFFLGRFIMHERARRRQLREEEELRKRQLARDQALAAAEQAEDDIPSSIGQAQRNEDLEAAVAMAREHPDDVALLIRTWLMEE